MKNFFSSFIGKEKDYKEQTINKTTSGNNNIQLNNTSNIINNKVNPFKTRSKEVIENVKEEESIKIFGESKNYKFDFKVYGRSLFQNLILTASAYVVNDTEKEAIPIKCVWRRLKRDTVVYIKDINSNSYIPTAEDIGYIIEVEATPIDGIVYGTDSTFGQYGPITMDTDMKNTIELLLTSGGTKFSCSIYDLKEQEKINNKEIIIYINTNELKLVETDYNGNEKLLESVKYHQSNPIIKLHPYDSYRFTLKFFEFEFQDEDQVNGGFNYEKLTQKIRSEYHLIAMSKQCRELVYLLIQFFLIDEKIKNNKLFHSVNYSSLPYETKIGVTDLISEIKTLREENNIFMNNMKFMERVNKELKEEMKNLEEDFQITLESINNNAHSIEQESEKYKNSKLMVEIVNVNQEKTSNFFDLKKKYDEIRENYSSMLSKEKALREEIKELILQVEILKNTCTEIKNENKKIKSELDSKELEITSSKKTINVLSETKNKLQKTNDSLNEEIKKFGDLCDSLKNTQSNSSNTELYLLQNKFSEIQKQNENLVFENKNLIVQRNLLSNQKDVISKEFEKLKKQSQIHEDKYSSLSDEIENLKSVIKEKENINLSMNTIVENLKKERNEQKNKLEVLEIEYNSMKENFDKMLFSNSIDTDNMLKITVEEYEEFDQLRKEKDESDALIMQLKSNNQAKDLEIENLKMLIESFKNK